MAGAWVERPGRVVNINRAIVGVLFFFFKGVHAVEVVQLLVIYSDTPITSTY